MGGGWTTRCAAAARALAEFAVRAPGLALILAVRGYQIFVSPLLGPRCRFYPSCSAYALTAVQRHGALRGSWLAVRRLCRCHPWNPGGVDHVPPAAPGRSTAPPSVRSSARSHPADAPADHGRRAA